MDFNITPGRYVVAVSGGVDSVVLLDLLSKKPGLELAVAHFNHGIRNDSNIDEQFVTSLASKYKLTCEIGYGQLGSQASENTARKARYMFLSNLKDKYEAKAIITAHHQDDVIETAILNMIRGTKRKGLSSLKSTTAVLRPLLEVSKKDIVKYAKTKNLKWIEDPSNSEQNYLRNRIRINIMPKINSNPATRSKILRLINRNQKLDSQITEVIATKSQKIVNTKNNRYIFTMLPDEVSKEVLAQILRDNNIKDIDSKKISALKTYIKTGAPNSESDIKNGYSVKLDKTEFYISKPKV